MFHYLTRILSLMVEKKKIFKWNLGMDAGHDYLIGRFSDVTSVTWNKRILTSKGVNKSHRYFVNRSINTW
jgi:hypothetical protein